MSQFSKSLAQERRPFGRRFCLQRQRRAEDSAKVAPERSRADRELLRQYEDRLLRPAENQRAIKIAGERQSVNLSVLLCLTILFVVQFVFGFEPFFERVTAVDAAVTLMNPVSTSLDIVQRVRVFVLASLLGVADCQRGLYSNRKYNLV
ncbi:MAG: hypothetical protein WA192_14490 [Candidatus Acidiferrales bacterium]